MYINQIIYRLAIIIGRIYSVVMSYSIEFRRRAVGYVDAGFSKRYVCRLLGLSPDTLYRWLRSGDDLGPKRYGERCRKISPSALRRHVQDHPDALQRERAAYFGVHPSSISYRLKRMKIVKKTATLSAKMCYEKDALSASST